jgi:hypothetical protein
LAMAISKYGHWRGGASQDWQAPKIIYYNRRIQNNDIFTIWIVNNYVYIYVNLTVTKRTRNKCIRSAETHFSFGQFIHKEYVSMDATSLRKLLQRGATVWNKPTWNSLNTPANSKIYLLSLFRNFKLLHCLNEHLKVIFRDFFSFHWKLSIFR